MTEEIDLTEPEKEVIRALRRQNEDLTADDLALVRTDDHRRVREARKEALQAVEIPQEEAKHLSLESLLALSDGHESRFSGTPDPATGTTEEVAYQDPEEAEILRARLSAYREKGWDAAADKTEKELEALRE